MAEINLGLEDLKRDAEKKARAEAGKRMSEIVNKCGNPELAKAVLQRVYGGCQNREYLDSVARSLDIPRQESDGIVAYFSELGIFYINRDDRPSWSQLPDTSSAMIVPGIEEAVKNYFESDLPYGPRQLLDRKDLSSKVVQQAMNALSADVDFSYYRRFNLPLEVLEVLRQRSHDALKGIRESERKFLAERLGIPLNFDIQYLTFVGEKDPTTRENGFREREFCFSGGFQSVDEAFAIGFGDASAGIKISAEKPGRGGWAIIDVKNYGLVCDIQMTDPTCSIISNDGSFGAQQEVRRKVPEILKKVTTIIS